MMATMSTQLFIFSILSLILTGISCFQTEWESNQLKGLELQSEFYADKKFNSTEEVIKDARLVVNNWMNLKSANKAGLVGTVFGFSVKGKTVWTEGFGYTDIENNVTTDKNSVWRLASISKPLTAALVAHLIDKKLLDLNKTVADYLPKSVFPSKSFDGKEVNITLRQLLSHTAGLHLTVLDDFNSLYEATNATQSLNRLKDEKLLFAPGKGFSYSNYGFQVVGAIIESVLNNTYPNEMKKFFSGFKMNSTFAETREPIIEHRPKYYTPSAAIDGILNPIHINNVGVIDDLFSYEGWWPSGGMVSTVQDLLAFGNAMINSYKGKNNEFLSQSVVKELWTPETKGIHKNQDFGKNEYGWVVIPLSDLVPNYPYKTLVWHSGGLLGTSTLLFLFPEEELVGVAFSNMGGTLGADQILLYVAMNLKEFI